MCGAEPACKGIMPSSTFFVIIAFAVFLIVVIVIAIVVSRRIKRQRQQIEQHIQAQANLTTERATRNSIVY
jgi:large-conductance mechanosensitive channel